MTEPKLTEEINTSPYDLWPDEVAPFEVPQDSAQFTTVAEEPLEDSFGAPVENFEKPFDAPFVPVSYTPETTEQAVRNSGLAWSAGVVFFGAVAFMLFLGWGADLLLGSSPWGIVIGIVLGSIIGFLQFFRISSQIFASNSKAPEHRPLLTRDEDDEE